MVAALVVVAALLGWQVYGMYFEHPPEPPAEEEEALPQPSPHVPATTSEQEHDGEEIMFGKPVIYLYPEEEQEVFVQLEFEGEFIATYPEYGQGWRVKASPDGRLADLADGQDYSYLFWEGTFGRPFSFDMSQGFVVRGQDTREFLQETLAKFGFTPREYNEFVVYWYPLMKDNPYNLIHFATEEYERIVSLKVNPRPDSLLRVFMAYQPLDNPVPAIPQEIIPFERRGFAVVEWGGTKLK